MNARNAEIVRRFNAGETMHAIGVDLGLTRERVRQIVKKAGCKATRQSVRERHEAIVAALRANNWTSLEASDALSVRRELVTFLALKSGVSLRVDHVWDTPEYAELAKKVQAGASIGNAAGHVPLIEKRLFKHCIHYGIRSAHGRFIVRSGRAKIIKRMRAERATWKVVAAEIAKVEGYACNAKSIAAWADRHMVAGEYDRPKPPPKQLKPKPERASVGVGKGKGRRVNRRDDVRLFDEIKEAARANYGRATAAEIARAHGVTRNSIIGHWFRLRKAGLLPVGVPA